VRYRGEKNGDKSASDSLMTSNDAIPIRAAHVNTPIGSRRAAPAGYNAEERSIFVDRRSVKSRTTWDITSNTESTRAARTDNDLVRKYAYNFVNVMMTLAYNEIVKARRRRVRGVVKLVADDPILFVSSAASN